MSNGATDLQLLRCDDNLQFTEASWPLIAGCLYDAWLPAAEWLFNRVDAGRVIQRLWHTAGSEIAREHARVAVLSGAPVGILTALPANEVRSAQRSGVLQMLGLAGDRQELVQRLRAQEKRIPSGALGTGQYLSRFAIAPAFRGLGLSVPILTLWLHEVTTEGWPCATLDVARANLPALRVYERCGFVVVGDWPQEPDGYVRLTRRLTPVKPAGVRTLSPS